MKKSFSMVELIFAIIIVALAIGALPTVVNQVNESTKHSISQEAIWMASGLLFDILDYQWDESTMQTVSGQTIRKAVDVSASADSELRRNGTTRFRIGHIFGDERRSFFTSTRNATDPLNLGSDASDTFRNDMDDFTTSSSLNLRNTYATDILGYKKNYQANIQVFYIDDETNYDSTHITFRLTNNPSTYSTNIKLIQVIISNCDNYNTKVLTFSTFSCNIGEYLDLMNKEK